MTKTYSERLQEGLFSAVMEAGMDREAGVATVMSGDVILELINMIALFAHSSEECVSPAKTRKFVDNLAQKLRRRISAAQDLAARGQLDFITTIHVDQEH